MDAWKCACPYRSGGRVDRRRVIAAECGGEGAQTRTADCTAEEPGVAMRRVRSGRRQHFGMCDALRGQVWAAQVQVVRQEVRA